MQKRSEDKVKARAQTANHEGVIIKDTGWVCGFEADMAELQRVGAGGNLCDVEFGDIGLIPEGMSRV